METVGAFTTRITENFDGEWSSFGGMCSTEEADFMAQLFVNSSLPDEQPSHESYINNMGGKAEGFPECSSIDINSSSMSFLSQGRCYSGSGGIHFPPGYQESYYTSYSQPMLMRNDSSITMERGMVDGEYVIISPSDQVHTNNIIHETSDFFNQGVSNDSIESGENIHEAVLLGKGLQLGRDYEMPELEQSRKNKVECQSEISKKRSRLPGDVPKNKRSVKQKENTKTSEDIDGKTNVLRRQNSMMSCCSENESNVSHELNGLTSSSNTKMRAGSLNSNGKARASKGSASDPQSMYARKRREKINERLRILQNLVPNGTKVDISTMLEEAVQYVKFLQLQIKLLSSDDHWMYAPIAYNGMDIGLDLNIGIPKS